MAEKFSLGIIRRYWAENAEMEDATSSREEIRNYLKYHAIPFSDILDELLERPEDLLLSGVKVLISPAQRWFNEKYYNGLIRYAEKGGTVLSTYPSFWKNENGDVVIRQRFLETFGVDDVQDRKIDGKILFRPSTERWLFDGLPDSVNTNEYGWVVKKSSELSEGEWQINSAYCWESNEQPLVVDLSLQGQSTILCLIRKWPSGGMFIYINFHLVKWIKKDPRIGRILDNVAKKSSILLVENSRDKSNEFQSLKTQIRVLKIILAVMGLIIGLLVSRYFFSGSDFIDLMKSAATALLTGLVTYALTGIFGKKDNQ